MTYALSSGVMGLQAHQTMLDVAGNNLANVNTTAFKASRVGFAELLGQTLQQGSRPTDQLGGTNPQKIGSGVGVASITPNTGQGGIVNTGNPFDVAIDGQGYFVVNDGNKNVYTRAGTFAVDEDGHLVDPSTGFLVQRIGVVGESDGFQTVGDSSINVPYDVSLPAQQTTSVTVTGNLSADETNEVQTQVSSSTIAYSYSNGSTAVLTTEIDQMDQFTGGSQPDGQLGGGESGTITISGYHPDGTAFSSGLTFTVNDTTTCGDFIDHLNNNVLTGSTASLYNGRIRVTDDTTGYSRSDISISYSGTGTLDTPAYFELTTVGGDSVKNVNIGIYDSQGGKHVLSAAFVKTDTINTWDLVITSVTGGVESINLDERRINGVSFDPQSGAFTGIPITETSEFIMTFSHDPVTPQTVAIDLGTVGGFDGITQFAGSSTAVAREQDGYGAGSLTSVSIDRGGVLVGAFSNGTKRDIATMAIGLFNNDSGLLGIGGGYFIPSPNSGDPVIGEALTGGAGATIGGALEKSNADVATEFVTLIQAQNGYQANARTIRVANEVLQELANLIR